MGVTIDSKALADGLTEGDLIPADLVAQLGDDEIATVSRTLDVRGLELVSHPSGGYLVVGVPRRPLTRGERVLVPYVKDGKTIRRRGTLVSNQDGRAHVNIHPGQGTPDSAWSGPAAWLVRDDEQPEDG